MFKLLWTLGDFLLICIQLIIKPYPVFQTSFILLSFLDIPREASRTFICSTLMWYVPKTELISFDTVVKNLNIIEWLVFIQTLVSYFIADYKYIMITRVCGITGSASVRRWVGYGFNSRPKPRHREKLYPLLLCQMSDIYSKSRGNALAPNRYNSIPYS